MNRFNRTVLTVHQSPMNPRQWLLTLDCHHEVWVTSKTRPTRKSATCSACKAKTRKDLQGEAVS